MAGLEDYINGIRIFKNFKNSVTGVLLDSNQIKKSLDVMRETQCRKMVLAGEFLSSSLEFLRKYDVSCVEEIAISKSISDFSPLEEIGDQIKLLHYSRENLSIDLNKYSNLEQFKTTWNDSIKGLNNCRALKALCLSKYLRKDLKLFSGLEILENLEINYSKIETLEGLQNLKNLVSLDLDNCKKLKNLSGLISSHRNLINIRIFNCPVLRDASSLGELSLLENLHIGRVKELQDLEFLSSMNGLKKCIINPKNVGVVNNDYSQLNNHKQK